MEMMRYPGASDHMVGGVLPRFDRDAVNVWLTENLGGRPAIKEASPYPASAMGRSFRVGLGDKTIALRFSNEEALGPAAPTIEREFDVLRAMHAAGIPVPKPLALCVDPQVAGLPFLVTEHVEGRNLAEVVSATSQPSRRGELFDAVNRTIARVHMLDPRPLGLTEFGGSRDYFPRHLRRWTARYLDDGGAGKHPPMDALLEWLPCNIPPDRESAIIHGNLHAGNLLFHPTEPRVVALLGWDLSTIGSSVSDFVRHLLIYRLPRSLCPLDVDMSLEGIPEEADYISAYCQRTGRGGLSHLNFHLAFNLFGLAVAAYNLRRRVADGAVPTRRALKLADRFERVADLAFEARRQHDLEFVRQ